MPSFTSAERDAISARLREAGARLFAAQGARKTTLEDLTGPAGISKASFYSFYSSKESLYIDLLLEQADGIAERIIRAATEPDDLQAGIAALLREIVAVLETNPLYRRFLSHPDEVRAIHDRIGPAELERANRALSDPLLAFIEEAQRTGELVPADPTAVLGVLRSAVLVTLHREEFAPDVYQQTLDLTIDTVAAGITCAAHPAWRTG
ncbi:AcrR family transcriptional regulator [Lipingzhangella halophila]|uniref:AcrR family transcriptional regulator n=1 Tax=Lipingzhangella halophila TaxID=1783352 RepID=A0A7W7RLS4_9ACTN|nr:TetR/AcrR family transcriptional regulator [Lipingzhangella halophila]MBB4934314.1 AcrR family transcriptional regulator [Lipingzhangella halophila]